MNSVEGLNRRLVTFCVPSLAGGGAEKAMLDIAVQCVRLGWGVDFVIVNGSLADYQVDEQSGLHVVDLGCTHVRYAIIPLVRYLRARRPAAMFTTLNHMNNAAVIAWSMARVPTILVLREADTLMEWKRAVMQIPDRMLYRRASAVIAVSNDVRDMLIRHGRVPRAHICVIRNPIDVHITQELAQAAVGSFHWDRERPTIVGAGRLEPVKDFTTLVKAFALVHARHPCQLVLLGKGSQLPILKDTATRLGVAQDTYFPGFVANPYAWMARAKVFVLSSQREGCPNVLLQALACGCQVVATDAPGDARFLLRDGTLGELVPVGDAATMAGAIERALAAGRCTDARVLEDWLEEFSPEATAVKYLAAAGLTRHPR